MLDRLKSLFSQVMNWLLIILAVGFGILFATANRATVRVSLDPFAGGDGALSMAAPLSLVILISIFTGIIVGGIGGWLSAGRTRRLARQRAYENRKLKKELKTAEDANLPSTAVAISDHASPHT